MSRAKSRKVSKYQKSPKSKGSQPSPQDSSTTEDPLQHKPDD